VEGWTRSGLRLANAQVVRVGPERELALVLVDDSPESHTDWITPKAQAFRVQPGERLVFEWDEFYSIGIADFGSVSYEKLPAGLYRFRMVGLSFRGVPTGAEASVAVEVPVAFWKTSWFWLGNLLALGGLITGAWRLAEWRRMKRQLQAVEAERAVERERFRIAQDIHDDLGARVTEISLLSSSAQEQKNLSEEARASFGRVSRMSQNLVGALYETVWAVSPENDHLDSLATYVCQVANQICSQAGLKCRLEIPDLPHDIPLTSSTRHNLVMTIKEAIHNTVKHAQATEIQIRIRLDDRLLTIDINDDGKGFDCSIKLRGNGLSNMARRMEAVGGRWSQRSQPGAGTQIHLEWPLESHGHAKRVRNIRT
jgi:signal transduction histidine kinase